MWSCVFWLHVVCEANLLISHNMHESDEIATLSMCTPTATSYNVSLVNVTELTKNVVAINCTGRSSPTATTGRTVLQTSAPSTALLTKSTLTPSAAYQSFKITYLCPGDIVTYTCTFNSNSPTTIYTLWTGSGFQCQATANSPANTLTLSQQTGAPLNTVPGSCGILSAVMTNISGTCYTSVLTIPIPQYFNGTTVTCSDGNFGVLIGNDALNIQLASAPSAPTITSQISTYSDQLSVTWTSVPTATSYNVSINDSVNTLVPIPSTGGPQYTFTGLTNNTVYTVSVVAINCAGSSSSATITGRTASAPSTALLTNLIPAIGIGVVTAIAVLVSIPVILDILPWKRTTQPTTVTQPTTDGLANVQQCNDYCKAQCCTSAQRCTSLCDMSQCCNQSCLQLQCNVLSTVPSSTTSLSTSTHINPPPSWPISSRPSIPTTNFLPNMPISSSTSSFSSAPTSYQNTLIIASVIVIIAIAVASIAAIVIIILVRKGILRRKRRTLTQPTCITDGLVLSSQPLSELISQGVKDSEGKPTLQELLSFSDRKVNIAEQIGANYWKFGIFLLKDSNGAIVTALENEHLKNAERINVTILQRWLNGKGLKPVTWPSLVTVLHDIERSV